MGADRWTTCPACKNAADERQRKAIAKAEKSYGQVPPDKYLEMINKANERPELSDTLREDWEIGIDSDGEFSVSYRASCQACDFQFTYKHSANATQPEATP